MYTMLAWKFGIWYFGGQSPIHLFGIRYLAFQIWSLIHLFGIFEAVNFLHKLPICAEGDVFLRYFAIDREKKWYFDFQFGFWYFDFRARFIYLVFGIWKSADWFIWYLVLGFPNHIQQKYKIFMPGRYISFVGQNDLPTTVTCFWNVASDLRVQNMLNHFAHSSAK
jgi:hypothetical protein